MSPASPAATLATLEALPDRLAATKDRLGLSYRDLADAMDVPLTTVYRFVRRTHPPEMKVVVAALRFLAGRSGKPGP